MGLLKTLLHVAMLGDFVTPAIDLARMAAGDDLIIVEDLETAVALSSQPGHHGLTNTADGRWMLTKRG